ncbi:MAG TPA: hypothetical protein VF487_20295 [Chitinophagaceae bacterium]
MRKHKQHKQLVKLITSCDKLMMDKFIEMLLTENYSPLIISGHPSSEEVEAAWNSIMCEYAEGIGSEHYLRVVELTKEINAAIMKFNRIALFVSTLANTQYSAAIAGMLRKMGYPGRYDPTDRDSYMNELEATLSKAKTLLLNAQRKQAELKNLESSVEKGKSDRKHFDELIILLSAHNKYHVKEHDITVQKYYIMVRNMNRQIELSNRKEYGRSTHR